MADGSEVDKTIWKHRLTIVEPARAKTRIGGLIIGGGAPYPDARDVP